MQEALLAADTPDRHAAGWRRFLGLAVRFLSRASACGWGVACCRATTWTTTRTACSRSGRPGPADGRCGALQSLGEHYRSVILLRDVEERTMDEIAAALGVTRQATKARLRRARGPAREYLVQ